MMKITKISYLITLSLIFALLFSVTAFASLLNGTVLIGNIAYSVNYANDSSHKSEIDEAISNSNGKIYVKGFHNEWIDNSTGKLLTDGTVITYDRYIDDNGKILQVQVKKQVKLQIQLIQFCQSKIFLVLALHLTL